MEKQENDGKVLKTLIAGALVAGGAYLIYRAVKVDWNGLIDRGYEIETLQASVKLKFNEINRNSAISRKMSRIKQGLVKSDWVSKYGASLALFGELEGFLEGMLIKHKLKVETKNLSKKIGRLKGAKVIEYEDFQSIQNLIGLRNHLAHGSYQNITDTQLMSAFKSIDGFIRKYSGA